MKDLILSEIWIYPVKSLGGVRLPGALALEKGLQHDRRWMLVDDQGSFITQRQLPALSLFKVSFSNGALEVSRGQDKLALPLSIHSGATVPSRIWDDQVAVIEHTSRANEWFSDHLGKACRLVYFPEKNERRVDPAHVAEPKHVSLADGYPLLVIGENSLADLNARLTEPLPMNRFRPNLVFAGGAPFEEDNWKEFTIGLARFRAVKTCGRCVVTTINQQTGVQGKEPLATLSKFRKVNNQVLFGMNGIVLEEGTIREGEKIEIETFR